MNRQDRWGRWMVCVVCGQRKPDCCEEPRLLGHCERRSPPRELFPGSKLSVPVYAICGAGHGHDGPCTWEPDYKPLSAWQAARR